MTALLGRRETYADHRDYVLNVLARRCGWLDAGEREEALHDAYAVLLEKERAGRIDTSAMHSQQIRAYLTQTAINKALDEGKRAGRRRSEPIGERALAEADPADAPEEMASARMHDAQVREIVGELPERSETIVKLRFYFDRTPAEIQRYLGVTERVYRRELERALRQLADAYQPIHDDTYCDTRRSLILGFVAGVAGPGRTTKAREHMANCPGCAQWAAELRAAAERLAAVLPLPPLVLHDSPLSRLGESLAAVRDGLLDTGTAAKQQAYAMVTRVDPSTAHYTAAFRPGAAAAAVAGCLAVGGGAVYCVVESVPQPVRDLAGISKPHEKPAPAKPRARRTPAPTPVPVASASSATVARRTAATATPAPRRSSTRRKQTTRKAKSAPKTQPSAASASAGAVPTPRPLTLPADEFGIEPPRQSTAPTQAPTSRSAPAGGGEFDP